MRQADVLGPVELLHLRIDIEAATIEQQHALAGAHPLERYTDPRCTSTIREVHFWDLPRTLTSVTLSSVAESRK